MTQYSIKDIARLSGVSIATVSRVLNNRGKYSENTKRKVLKVIQDTGYKIDSSAQSLRTNVTHTIGILVPDIKNPFFADLVQKIEENLFTQKYSTIICNTDKDEQKEKAYLHMLEAKKVDGIIVISGSYKHGFQFESSSKNIPYICIDRAPQNFEDTIFISSNHRLGSQEATNYLINCGSKNPVIITGSKIGTSIESRIEGFKDALRQNHLNFSKNKNSFIYTDWTSIQNFLTHHPETDAFFAVDDNIAINVLTSLKKLNYHIPEDIQIIGFDDIPSSRVVSPSLTTIAQNTTKIATTAINSLLELLVTPSEKGNQILIPTKLIIRNSTKQS